jgi:hypothetical protein
MLLVIFGIHVSSTTILASQCICLPPENSCSQATWAGDSATLPTPNRCHLNSSISTTSYIPSWVTPNVTILFDSTYQQAMNNTLISSTNSGYFEAGMACNFDAGAQPHWADYCDTYDGSGPYYFTGYASLGFHPFGTAPGLWLTQILAPFGQENLGPSGCPELDFYVNITLINGNAQVYDWVLNLVVPEHIGPPGYPAIMTDNALLADGIDLNCNNLLSVNSYAPPVPSKHVDCPSIHRTKTVDEMACEVSESPSRKCTGFNITCPNDIVSKSLATLRYGGIGWLCSVALITSLLLLFR